MTSHLKVLAFWEAFQVATLVNSKKVMIDLGQDLIEGLLS